MASALRRLSALMRAFALRGPLKTRSEEADNLSCSHQLMSSSHPFGVHLRRARMRAGISLEQIARDTNVAIKLWEDMEGDDFSGWPSGIYARQWIDAYARLVGLDPIETVDEFCRACPQGDRRSESLMRGHAELLGHVLAWQDDVPARGDRRQSMPRARSAPTRGIRWLRVTVAGADLIVVTAVAGIASLVVPFRMLSVFAVVAGLYYGLSTGAVGCTPIVWLLEAYGSTALNYGRYHATAFRRLTPTSKQSEATR